jgi:hypothetical protein
VEAHPEARLHPGGQHMLLAAESKNIYRLAPGN